MRWGQLCEQTRHALPFVDLQSAEDALDEMRVLTTPVGLSWWIIFAEVHQLNVFSAAQVHQLAVGSRTVAMLPKVLASSLA